MSTRRLTSNPVIHAYQRIMKKRRSSDAGEDDNEQQHHQQESLDVRMSPAKVKLNDAKDVSTSVAASTLFSSSSSSSSSSSTVTSRRSASSSAAGTASWYTRRTDDDDETFGSLLDKFAALGSDSNKSTNESTAVNNDADGTDPDAYACPVCNFPCQESNFAMHVFACVNELERLNGGGGGGGGGGDSGNDSSSVSVSQEDDEAMALRLMQQEVNAEEDNREQAARDAAEAKAANAMDDGSGSDQPVEMCKDGSACKAMDATHFKRFRHDTVCCPICNVAGFQVYEIDPHVLLCLDSTALAIDRASGGPDDVSMSMSGNAPELVSSPCPGSSASMRSSATWAHAGAAPPSGISAITGSRKFVAPRAEDYHAGKSRAVSGRHTSPTAKLTKAQLVAMSKVVVDAKSGKSSSAFNFGGSSSSSSSGGGSGGANSVADLLACFGQLGFNKEALRDALADEEMKKSE